jgi:hypothetical protein
MVGQELAGGLLEGAELLDILILVAPLELVVVVLGLLAVAAAVALRVPTQG